jgi:hypothetical protein
MGSNAFIDDNFPQGKEFLVNFLNSPEFNLDTLRKIKPSNSSRSKKFEIAQDIAVAFEKGDLSANQILLPYVKRSRQWLSFRLGQVQAKSKQKNPKLLLNEFGNEGWYGPLQDNQNNNNYYIRIQKITDYSDRSIRWTVIAEVSSSHIALSWNGFTLLSATDSKIERQVQFAFWKFIPEYFEEISEFCKVMLIIPNLHKLILHDMWDKYISNQEYRWHHLRIRAESSGVALNAHSSRIQDINVEGLKALSKKLAESVLESVDIRDNNKISWGENAALRTLLKEWGTKSYEFDLEQLEKPNDDELQGLNKKSKYSRLVKVHCYFGLKFNFQTQDSLQHLKCDCGGSTEALKFLLRELKFYSDENI